MSETDSAQTTTSEVTREEQPKTTGKEKRPLSIWRRMFRILLGILIVFGLGALLVIFTLYIPLRQQHFESQERIKELTTQSDTELEAANEKIGQLTSIEDKYNDTLTKMDILTLQNAIMKIQLDVTSAKLALVSENPDDASKALSQTANRIEELKNLLPKDQQKDAENLSKRLDLVLGEIEEDKFAAVSDLEVILAILSSLEEQAVR